MTMLADSSALLLLHPNDTVLIAARAVAEGTPVLIDGAVIRLPQAVALGHKVARRALAAGDRVLRYGVPIGTMTAPAAPGGHVHAHNLTSDYLPSHTRGTVTGKDRA